jgi:hypothetical protein
MVQSYMPNCHNPDNFYNFTSQVLGTHLLQIAADGARIFCVCTGGGGDLDLCLEKMLVLSSAICIFQVVLIHNQNLWISGSMIGLVSNK